MVLYKEAMSELKAGDKRRERADEQARRDKAAAQRHSPDDDIPTALHASTPSEPATRDTLDCTGLPRMYEGVFIRMTHSRRAKVDYLTTTQAGPLVHLEPRTISGYCAEGRLPGSWQAGGVGVGAWRIPVLVFWAYVQKDFPALVVRVQAHWPHEVEQPWKG